MPFRFSELPMRNHLESSTDLNVYRMWKEYGALFDKLAEDPSDVRVVVLSSSIPKHFTAGLDCTLFRHYMDSYFH